MQWRGGVQSSTQMNDICYCMHALSVSGLRREVLCSLLLLCLLPCYRIDDAVFGKQTGREAKKVVTHHGSVTHRRRGPRQHVSNAATPPLECAAVCAHTLVFVFQWYHSWNAAVLCLNACLCVLSTNDECWAKTLISYCFLFLQFAKEVVILRLTRMSEGLGGVTHSCCQHSSARMCVCHCQSRLILHITAKTVALGPFHCTANPASGPRLSSESLNPIIARLTVIARIRDTLTCLERMKTSTVRGEWMMTWGRDWVGESELWELHEVREQEPNTRYAISYC